MGGADSKLSADDKASLESLVEEKIKWLEAHPGASTEELKAAKQAVEEVATPIFSKLYSQEGGAGNGAGNEGGNDDGADAEKDEL